jgi:hypothetical protein
MYIRILALGILGVIIKKVEFKPLVIFNQKRKSFLKWILTSGDFVSVFDNKINFQLTFTL